MDLLDPCVVSEARRRTPQAVVWLRGTQSETVFLSVISIGTITTGSMLTARSDPPRAMVLMRWLNELRFVHFSQILPIDDANVVTLGMLMAQRSRRMADALIAATARVHTNVVVTRTIADFAGTGVAVVDPWEVYHD